MKYVKIWSKIGFTVKTSMYWTTFFLKFHKIDWNYVLAWRSNSISSIWTKMGRNPINKVVKPSNSFVLIMFWLHIQNPWFRSTQNPIWTIRHVLYQYNVSYIKNHDHRIQNGCQIQDNHIFFFKNWYSKLRYYLRIF